MERRPSEDSDAPSSRQARRASEAAVGKFDEDPDDFSDSHDSADEGKRPAQGSVMDDRLRKGSLAERCAEILDLLRRREGSHWFAMPAAPAEAPARPVQGVTPIVPSDYATVSSRLEAGEFASLSEFASAVRQIFIDAITAHFDPTDEQHVAARGALEALEQALVAPSKKSSAPRERSAHSSGYPRESRPESESLRLLYLFLEGCGASAKDSKGWTTKLDLRKDGVTAGTTDLYFISREGKRFRSRAEIARYYELDYAAGDAALREERERAKQEKMVAKREEKEAMKEETEAREARETERHAVKPKAPSAKRGGKLGKMTLPSCEVHRDCDLHRLPPADPPLLPPPEGEVPKAAFAADLLGLWDFLRAFGGKLDLPQPSHPGELLRMLSAGSGGGEEVPCDGDGDDARGSDVGALHQKLLHLLLLDGCASRWWPGDAVSGHDGVDTEMTLQATDAPIDTVEDTLMADTEGVAEEGGAAGAEGETAEENDEGDDLCSSDVLDSKLWPGAHAQGWSARPRHTKGSSRWYYFSPRGTQVGSRAEARDVKRAEAQALGDAHTVAAVDEAAKPNRGELVGWYVSVLAWEAADGICTDAARADGDTGSSSAVVGHPRIHAAHRICGTAPQQVPTSVRVTPSPLPSPAAAQAPRPHCVDSSRSKRR